MGLGLKLLLATLSGFLVMLAWFVFVDADTVPGQLGLYGLCGALFASGVLLPYMDRRTLFGWRSMAAIAVSGVSFYCAVYVASEWSSNSWRGPGLQDYVTASIVGATIVLVPGLFLLPLRFSMTYAVAGALAAVAGGISFGFFEPLFVYSFFLSFGSWHALMSLALHVSQSAVADESWLAGVDRSKLGIVVGLASLPVVVPLVDDATGVFLRHRFDARDGGLKIIERVDSNGFLDRRKKSIFSSDCGFGCLTPVIDGTYEFQEYEVDDDRGRYLRFFVKDRPDPNCHDDAERWRPTFEPTWDARIFSRTSRCLTYRLSGNSTAEYAIRDDRKTVKSGFGLYPLQKTTRQVVRTGDGAVVAEAVYYLYESRFFGDSFGGPEPWSEFLLKALPASGNE